MISIVACCYSFTHLPLGLADHNSTDDIKNMKKSMILVYNRSDMQK